MHHLLLTQGGPVALFALLPGRSWDASRIRLPVGRPVPTKAIALVPVTQNEVQFQVNEYAHHAIKYGLDPIFTA
jgi:hypothetical protein